MTEKPYHEMTNAELTAAMAKKAVKVAQCNHALVDRSQNPWRCATCGAAIHNPPQRLK